MQIGDRFTEHGPEQIWTLEHISAKTRSHVAAGNVKTLSVLHPTEETCLNKNLETEA